MLKNNKIIYQETNFSQSVVCATTTKHFGDLSFRNPQNINKLGTILRFPVKKIASVKQTHSTQIFEVTQRNIFYNNREGDGLYTLEPRFCLLIKSADCVPLLLFDKETKILMALHAGKIGIRKEIVLKGLRILKSKKARMDNTQVFFGPFIEKACYPTDLYQLISRQLLSMNIKKHNIRSANQCTFCKKDLYYSHHRGDIERMGTFAYMQ